MRCDQQLHRAEAIARAGPTIWRGRTDLRPAALPAGSARALDQAFDTRSSGWDLPEAFITLGGSSRIVWEGRQARHGYVQPLRCSVRQRPPTETFPSRGGRNAVGDVIPCRLGAIGFDAVKHLGCRRQRSACLRTPRLQPRRLSDLPFRDHVRQVVHEPAPRRGIDAHDRHTASGQIYFMPTNLKTLKLPAFLHRVRQQIARQFSRLGRRRSALRRLTGTRRARADRPPAPHLRREGGALPRRSRAKTASTSRSSPRLVTRRMVLEALWPLRVHRLA